MGDMRKIKTGGLPPDGAVREWARRHAADPAPGAALTDLLAGQTDEEVTARHGLPRAVVEGLRSFYDQIVPEPQACDGMACHFGGGDQLVARLAEAGTPHTVRCLGHCYAAPAFRSGDRVYALPARTSVTDWLAEWGEGMGLVENLAPIPRTSMAPEPVVLRNLLRGTPRGLDEYALPDGGVILEAIEEAGLRGRGGATYPTAAKWRAARDTPADERFVVVNGDEGDPGSFVDRLLLEEDPHAVLAGVVACARAIGARRAYVYIRAEYPRAGAIVRAALREARAGGVLGDLEIAVISGAGSYVCGEETALLHSIEGLRAEPRPKPPYPAVCGLLGRPTVVQNVETLALVPWVVRNRRRSGTKAVSLSGAVHRPGVVEIPLGTPLERLLQEAGGGPAPGRRWGLAMVGGPLGRVIPRERFDVKLGFDTLPGLGHAGIVVFDDRVAPRSLAEQLFAFARAESCGGCLPCRAGAQQLARMRTRESLERLLETMAIGSQCGFGQGVIRPIRDLLEHYGEAVLP